MTRFKSFMKNVMDTLKRPDMTILPGQLAFFFILSLVPTITIIMYIVSFMSISVNDITSYFNITSNDTIISLLTPAITDSEFSFGMLTLLVVGIYIASNGMNSIIVTANSIYGIEQKPFLERRVKSIIMVFILIMLFLFIILVPIFGNFLLNLIKDVSGQREIYHILNFLKTPFSWFTVFIFIKILYTIAPDKEIPSAYVNLGSLFTTIGWMVSTEIYLYYVGHFANYNIYYSSLSNIAILMIWVYILATIFVIGMGINHKEEPYAIEKTRELEAIKASKKNQHKKN